MYSVVDVRRHSRYSSMDPRNWRSLYCVRGSWSRKRRAIAGDRTRANAAAAASAIDHTDDARGGSEKSHRVSSNVIDRSAK